MNKNSSIIRSLLEMNGVFEKVSNQLNTAKNALSCGDNRRYEEQLSKVVASLENTCLRLRDLANYSLKATNNPLGFQRISDNLSDKVYGIKIGQENGVFRIVLPQTISHYGEISKCVLIAPLNNALRNYHKKDKIQKIKSAVIVFINHVNTEQSEAKIRDNDNYEYKQIINSLAYWFLPDDSFKCCNMFTTTKLDDRSYSEIFIVPSDKFIAFCTENISNIV